MNPTIVTITQAVTANGTTTSRPAKNVDRRIWKTRFKCYLTSVYFVLLGVKVHEWSDDDPLSHVLFDGLKVLVLVSVQ